MFRWVLGGFAVVASVGVLAGTASADSPIRVLQSGEVTFPSRFWSHACGFLVLKTQTGPFWITVHTAHDGSSAHELDTFNTMKQTLWAPSTGRSFQDNIGPEKYEYPEGIFLGAPALVIET